MGKTKLPLDQCKRVLLVGPGVIGGYLAHALCATGHDVTVVARGSWADVLERDGLVIRHLLQRRTTTDRPRVVRELPLGERFDAAFVVMREDQMVAIAPGLGAIDTPLVVCVGNDLHVDEVEGAIRTGSRGPKDVLFGFQSTAGVRRDGALTCVRAGAAGLTVGLAHGYATTSQRNAVDDILCGAYRATHEHDMTWWLVSHAVAVLPFCYLAYRLDCDLTRAGARDITQLTDAVREGFAAVGAAGGMVLPKGEETLFVPGPKRTMWELALRVVARTPIGRYCVTDHCRHAVTEMRGLDEGVMTLFDSVPGSPRPTWDAMRSAMPSWDELALRWRS